MASKAQICNLALAHLGHTETTIANLTTDTGNTATQCRIHYDVARKFVLADHDWNFAEREVTLAETGTPSNLWAYRYAYPSDCLKFRRVGRVSKTEKPIPFRTTLGVSGKVIDTNLYQAKGFYTADITNTSLFSPGFVEAFGWYLASALAPALTGDLKKQEMALNVYQAMISAAQTQDAQEQQPEDELDAPWISGR
jgi:hypothetical protein